MRVLVAAALAGLVFSGPVRAEDKPKDPSQKIVCKSERFVGSNMSTRICKTKAEWDDARKQSQENFDRSKGEMIMPKPKNGG